MSCVSSACSNDCIRFGTSSLHVLVFKWMDGTDPFSWPSFCYPTRLGVTMLHEEFNQHLRIFIEFVGCDQDRSIECSAVGIDGSNIVWRARERGRDLCMFHLASLLVERG